VRLRAYPVVEKWKWIWIWMGDPARADESLIPDFFWLDHTEWEAVGSSLELKARHQLLNENLLDLTHVEFVHRGSIGAQDLSEFPIETTVEKDKVLISRTMKGIEAPPLFVKTMGLPERIDRWQVEEFQPPCYHVVHVTAGPVGSDRDTCCQYKVINAVVPETRNRTRYLWSVSRNYRREEKWVSEYLRDAVQKVFMQDVEVCEAQELMLQSMPEAQPEMLARMDAGITSARRLLLAMQAKEKKSRPIKIVEATDA
jgi:phenylpropionate dioxygenase-like ring-hydroxylating dioxygenase large terminal subunit